MKNGTCETTFYDYFVEWVYLTKYEIVRDVTLRKYQNTAKQLEKYAPGLKMCDLDRHTYQRLILAYGKDHEKATCYDFHHQLRACLLDALDDDVIDKDPTRKVVIRGKEANPKKKIQFLSQGELGKLISTLDLGDEPNMDWGVLIAAKTGVRFAELLGLTPADFDLEKMKLSINKTWLYKDFDGEGMRFGPLKDESSKRVIDLDWKLAITIKSFLAGLPENEPIFVPKDENGNYEGVYNSTWNDFLEKHCKEAGVPVISMHGLRHTHASYLMAEGVSIHSIAARLGHASVETTQKVYLHMVEELAQKDRDTIKASLCAV